MARAAPITVFTGPMFSGKSDALILKLVRRERAKKKILVVKPKRDTRTEGKIVSRRIHPETNRPREFIALKAYEINSKKELLDLIKTVEFDVFGADEVHFFDSWFVDVVTDLAWNRGIEVVLAGLDLDAWRRPFGIMPQVLAIADRVEKYTADCFNNCTEEARFTQKCGGSSKQIEVGDKELYEARCGECWTLPQTQ